MDGAQVGIFKKSNQISLGCFLESHDSARLKPQISLEILSNFTNKSLKRQLANQKFSRLLITTNFTKSHSTGTITMWFLDSTSSRSRFPGSFGSQLFARSLSTGGFTGGLLGTSHLEL